MKKVNGSVRLEEKAEKWGKDYPKLPLSELPYTDSDIEAVAMNSYLQGATCQQDIDTEKACKAHCSLCSYIGLDGTCTLYEDTSKCEDVELIKQAMKQ